MKFAFFCILGITLSACSLLTKQTSLVKDQNSKISTFSPGSEVNAPNYGYTPIDPLPAYFSDNRGVKGTKADTGFKPVLEYVSGDDPLSNLMPHETMRMAIGKIDINGNVSFTTSSFGFQGSNYIVIMD